jgi:HK97 family phage prohead protease
MSTQTKTERRSFQMRAADNDFKLEGYAATFGMESNDLGGFKEIVAPGAFARSLAAKTDIHATVQHNFGALLGRTKNGSLSLVEDQRGLKFSIQLDKNSTLHKEVYNNVRSGLLDECSFTFCVEPEGQVWSADGKTRTLTDVDLIEVAIVALPAYPGTSADARSIAATADSAALLARVQAMPGEWARQERIHQASIAVATRSDTDNSEPEGEEDFTDEMQEAIAERFGSTRSGAHPAHYLVRYDQKRCYTRHLDSDTRCKMSYERDEDGAYSFGECEPDTDYCEPDDRSRARQATARELVADENLRIRMANAAGRTR